MISVILPAYNEAESIARVLDAIPRDGVGEILVVDGGSTDGTPAIAAACGSRVINEPRRGYGRACASGLAAASGDVVAFLDADGADDPRHLLALAEPVLAGRADLSLGSRLAGTMQSGAMPFHQLLGNRLAAAFLRFRFGLPLTDLSPFRVVHREKLLALQLQEMTFGYPTEMITRAVRAGWRIVEQPVGYRKRLGGRSKISGTLRGTLLATYYILSIIARG